MIKQAEKEYAPELLEKKIQKFWKLAQVYRKTKALKERGKRYYFIDTPVVTKGQVDLELAYNKILKDVIMRYRSMQGLNVRDQPGFCTQGLPIELQVESNLSIANKKQVEELVGIESFANSCKEYAEGLQRQMTEEFISLGIWLDWENPYTTMDKAYTGAVWWTLKRADEKNLLAKHTQVVPWCAECETALGIAEICYKEAEARLIYVKFLLKGRSGESILIWTTAPWTLPANMAVGVHTELDYAKVEMTIQDRKEILWLARDRVEDVVSLLGASNFQILEIVKGTEMVGWEYFYPLASKVPYQNQLSGEWIHKVIASDSIPPENTAVVPIAPGHSLDDFEIGEAHGIPPFSPVDERGHFESEAGMYAGRQIREVNNIVIEDLRKENWLLYDDVVTLRQAHCSMCDSPLIYRTSLQWFIRLAELKERILAELESLRCIPERGAISQLKEALESKGDWCISRQRYWGTPLPIWECECGNSRIIDSIKELSQGKNYIEDMEMHRPWIDSVVFECERCGKEMRRSPDVVDIWFDLGVCAWAELGYPSQKKEYNRWWPPRWMTEPADQIRSSIFSQLVAGMIAFEEIPFRSLLVHGPVLDASGQRMSEKLGNLVLLSDVVSELGADSLRFYMLKEGKPWEELHFDIEEAKSARRVLNILWNVHRFATLYMSLDKFDPNEWSISSLAGNFSPEDNWLLSRTENLKAEVENEIEEFNLHKAARALERFIVDDLSRWYVRLIRDKKWDEGERKKKFAAYKALHESLLSVIRLIAPLTPHISESMYQSLDAGLLSVHMTDWPEYDESLIDNKLEKSMSIVQEIVELVSKARQKVGMKLRWPIKRIVLKAKDEDTAKTLESMKEIMKQQTNSKGIEVLWPGEEWDGMVLTVRPKVEAIGRVYKQWWSKIATMLESRPVDEVKKAITEGDYKIGIEGQVIRIEPEMVEFEERLPEHVVSISFEYGDMYIDMEITPEIRAEGFAREIVRRIQQMRKEIDLDVDDYIRTQVKVKAELTKMLEEYEDYIAAETRSRTFDFVPDELTEEYVVEWNVDGDVVGLAITPLYMKETIDAFTRIPGIDEKEAMALFDHGYASMLSLQQASLDELIQVDGIDEIDARKIRRYFDQPEELRAEEKVYCYVCEAEVQSGATECQRCGVSLLPEMITCPSCEAQIPADSEECENCGSILIEEEVEEISDEIKEMMQIPGLGLEKAKMLHDLGYDLEKLANTPEEELIKIEGITVPLARKISEYFEEWVEELVCPLCNAPATADSTHCTQCGTMFMTEEEARVAEEESPSVEEAEEVIEVPSFDEDVITTRLKRSHMYLVKEERQKKAIDMFISALKEGRPGLCVTRMYPDKFRESYDVGDIKLLWLSNIGKEDAVRPKDLEKLSLSLEKFVGETGGVVLLDGLDYLITNNNFIIVLRLLQSLRDMVAVNSATMVVNVNPATLDSNQLNLLEREADSVVDATA